MDKLAEEIGTTQCLKNAFDPILNVILVALDAPPVFMRTKALRALSQILTVDSSVLANVSVVFSRVAARSLKSSQSNVRHAIESHLLDSSPAVRDAAVELIGKYMVDSPAIAGDYYQKIAERIAVSICSISQMAEPTMASGYWTWRTQEGYQVIEVILFRHR